MTIWPKVCLRDVAKIDRDGIDPGLIPNNSLYVGLEHIESGGRLLDVPSVSNGDLASTKFRFGSRHLLYGKLRPYLAKIALPDFEGVCSTDILPVLPSNRLDRNYLAYFLRQPCMVDYAASRSEGANLPRLSPKALAEFEIPLPPLAEQQRIAAILDQADEVRRKRRRVTEHLGVLLAAVFAKICGPSTPIISIESALDQNVLLVHKDGNHGSLYPRADDFGDEGVPFVSAKSISGTGFIEDRLTERLSETKAAALRHGWIEPGDVLLAHNATVGKVGLYRGEYDRAIVGTSLTVFRPNPKKLLPEFLFGALRGSDFQSQLTKNMGQTTRNQVPITAQRILSFALPDLNSQRSFQLKAREISDLRKRSEAQLIKLDALFASIQHRAFRGELTAKAAERELAEAG
jgi:type I restriction enzyme S subunit